VSRQRPGTGRSLVGRVLAARPPAKTPIRKPLVAKPKSLAVIDQDLHGCCRPVAKYEHPAVERIVFEHVFAQPRQFRTCLPSSSPKPTTAQGCVREFYGSAANARIAAGPSPICQAGLCAFLGLISCPPQVHVLTAYDTTPLKILHTRLPEGHCSLAMRRSRGSRGKQLIVKPSRRGRTNCAGLESSRSLRLAKGMVDLRRAPSRCESPGRVAVRQRKAKWAGLGLECLDAVRLRNPHCL